MTAIATGIETPCTRVCAVHPALQLCIGCGRSLDEIAGWVTFTDQDRARIMEQLPPRLEAIAAAKIVPAMAS
jgi:hypothetical protein